MSIVALQSTIDEPPYLPLISLFPYPPLISVFPNLPNLLTDFHAVWLDLGL